MTETEKFFRFPYKMYRNYDWRLYISKQNKEIESESGIVHDPPDYAIGYQCIDIGEIIGYSEAFTEGSNIYDVQSNGGDVTLVELKNGKELSCTWPLAEFEKHYNEFTESIKTYYEKKAEEDRVAQEERYKAEAERNTLIIKEILEKNLTEIKKKYEEQGIPLDLSQFEPSN